MTLFSPLSSCESNENDEECVESLGMKQSVLLSVFFHNKDDGSDDDGDEGAFCRFFRRVCLFVIEAPLLLDLVAFIVYRVDDDDVNEMEGRIHPRLAARCKCCDVVLV